MTAAMRKAGALAWWPDGRNPPDTMRKMMAIVAQDKDPDVARCATLLLKGFNQKLAGKL